MAVLWLLYLLIPGGFFNSRGNLLGTVGTMCLKGPPFCTVFGAAGLSDTCPSDMKRAWHFWSQDFEEENHFLVDNVSHEHGNFHEFSRFECW